MHSKLLLLYCVFAGPVASVFFYLFCGWLAPKFGHQAFLQGEWEVRVPCRVPGRTWYRTIAIITGGIVLGLLVGYCLGHYVSREWIQAYAAGISSFLVGVLVPFLEFFVVTSLIVENVITTKYQIALGIIAGAIGAWGTLHWHNWLMNDLGVFVGVTVFLSVLFSFLTVRRIVAVSLIVMAWDIYFVFFSGWVEGAIKDSLVGLDESLFIVPWGISLSAPPVMVLGCGDLFFSGLVILAAYRSAGKRGFWGALLGYCFGLCVADLMAHFYGAQPATIYLLPCAFAGLWLVSVTRPRKNLGLLGN